MATISVDGIDAKSAPSPILLKTWRDAWTGQLNNLSQWQAQKDNCLYTATTNSDVNATKGVAESDLKKWVQDDPGHRHYTIY